MSIDLRADTTNVVVVPVVPISYWRYNSCTKIRYNKDRSNIRSNIEWNPILPPLVRFVLTSEQNPHRFAPDMWFCTTTMHIWSMLKGGDPPFKTPISRWRSEGLGHCKQKEFNLEPFGPRPNTLNFMLHWLFYKILLKILWFPLFFKGPKPNNNPNIAAIKSIILEIVVKDYWLNTFGHVYSRISHVYLVLGMSILLNNESLACLLGVAHFGMSIFNCWISPINCANPLWNRFLSRHAQIFGQNMWLRS